MRGFGVCDFHFFSMTGVRLSLMLERGPLSINFPFGSVGSSSDSSRYSIDGFLMTWTLGGFPVLLASIFFLRMAVGSDSIMN